MSTPSILQEIIAKRKLRLENEKAAVPFREIKKAALAAPDRPSFYDAMAKDGLSIIGEIKKASPSKGLIKADFNPITIAGQYSSCVDAISVLTEKDYFLGAPEYLTMAADAAKLPALRKDFIIDEYQVFEAKALGASAILLIAAILDKKDLGRLIDLASSLEIDSLVETHSESEAEKSLAAGAKIIGINNRDLNTFDVSLETTLDIAKNLPKDVIIISESGIHTSKDVKYLKQAHIDGILVGESFMKSGDIAAKAREFKDAYKD